MCQSVSFVRCSISILKFSITWLFIAGGNAKYIYVRKLSAFAHWLFTRRFLVFLGQHSLQVFTFHMVLVYFVEVIFHGRQLSALEANVYLILCVMSLYLPAWLHAKSKQRERALGGV